MLDLFLRFGRSVLSSKLENQRQPLLDSLRVFESEISRCLSQLTQIEPPTLSRTRSCLRLLPTIENAFAKLVSTIDHPMTAWESASIELYLKESLNHLRHLNSITASVSRLQQSRLAASHALSVSQHSNKPIILPLFSSSNNSVNISKWGDRTEFCEVEEEKEEERGKGLCWNEEEIICEALVVVKRARCRVCAVVESSIGGDVESKEVAEMNESSSGGEEVIKEKVEEFGRELEGVEEDVNEMFSKTMERRNQLLDSLQQRKPSHS